MPTKTNTRTKTEDKKVEAKLKVAAKVTKPKLKKEEKTYSLSVSVFSLVGRESGNFNLPKEIFGVKINQNLLTQALRVYLSNQKSHHAQTKTRGEVEGSTRKVYRQKGTGGARHGARRAPIYVGGGIALGPKVRHVILDLPQKMKKAALLSALSQKAKDGEIKILSGLEKASGKTKEFAALAKKLEKKSVLILSDKKIDDAFRAVRNLSGMEILSTETVNVLDIIKHQSLLLTKEAVEALEKKLSSANNRHSGKFTRPEFGILEAQVSQDDQNKVSTKDKKEAK